MTKEIDWSMAYQKFGPRLLGVCRRYIKDIKIAEDILQEAFIIAIQKQDSFKGVGSLEGWLKRIVVNMSLNYLKTEQKNQYLTDGIMDIAETEDAFDGSNETKSSMYAVDFTKEELLDVIDALPSHHKTVFNLYVIDDFSHVKIGEMLNISVGTSKSHLHRARMKIQLFLFEKAKEKEVDKSKKLIIALLLFLGFENKILADTFRSNFSNFEIQPKRLNTDFENGFVKVSIQDSVSNIILSTLKYKFVIGVTAALVLALSFSKANPTDLFTMQKKKVQSEKHNTDYKEALTVSGHSIKKDDSLKTGSDTSFKHVINNKAVALPIHNPSVKTNPIKQRTSKQEAIVTKDTASDKKSRKVFIKKQIIKKDTIYVFK